MSDLANELKRLIAYNSTAICRSETEKWLVKNGDRLLEALRRPPRTKHAPSQPNQSSDSSSKSKAGKE